jgi:hypothetical protein
VEFANDAHRASYELVQHYVGTIFGDGARPDPTEPSFTINEGSAFATIVVRPWREWSATVESYSLVVTGVTRSEELYRFLLEENAELLFGAFGLKDETTVIFKHSVIGDSDKLDAEELESSVRAVLTMADQYDDEIVQRFGGLRASDRSHGA